MSAASIKDPSKLCIHTITTKPWTLEEAIVKYSKKGIKGISVWRQWLDKKYPEASGKLLREAGLDVVSLVRGGFFPGRTAEERQKAIDENKKTIDEAVAIGAPAIVLVCGAVPDQPLTGILIKPGCRHRAVGNLRVTIIAIPAFDPEDEWFD